MKTVYSGTTTKNFLDASFEKEGNLYYQKIRLKNTAKSNALFYDYNLMVPLRYALSIAVDLKDTNESHKPLVLQGKTNYYPYVPGDKPFKVDKVWILKNPNLCIKTIDSIIYKSIEEITKVVEEEFEEKSAIKVFRLLQY